MDSDRVGGFAIHGQHNIHFTPPRQAAREFDVDLIQSDKIGLCAGKRYRDCFAAYDDSHIRQTAVIANACAVQLHKHFISRI